MERFDVFVIGGGGTGSEIAFRLGERGDLRVGLAEREVLGGECNHFGCVPTKVMLRSATIAHLARSAGRFGVRVPGGVDVDLAAVRERARRVVDERSGEAPRVRAVRRPRLPPAGAHRGPHDLELADGTRIAADRIVLATGTEATVLPIEGLDEGPYRTNREAIWDAAQLPTSLVVIGTGAIGIEFSQIYARFGAHVTVLEALPHLLPIEDEEAAASLLPALAAEGIELRTGVRITSARHDGSGWRLELDGTEPLSAEHVLVVTGRRPSSRATTSARRASSSTTLGRPVLGETLRTTNPDIWAAGDATGELLFTHVGTYEADLVVDDISGRARATTGSSRA